MNKTYLPKYAIGEKVFFIQNAQSVGRYPMIQDTIVIGYDVQAEVTTFYPQGTKVRFDKDGNALDNPMERRVEKCRKRYIVPNKLNPCLEEFQVYPTYEAAEEYLRKRQTTCQQ